MPRHNVGLLLRLTVLGMAVMLPFACSKNDSPTNFSAGVITLTGRVIGKAGEPIASMPVVIGTLPPTSTDANGNFSVANVTTPYNATLVSSVNKVGIVYVGLTRSDPTLTFFESPLAPPSSATVTGTVSGGAGFPLPANSTATVVFASPEAIGAGGVNANSGVYSLSSTWTGAGATTGTLYALQWQKDPTTAYPVTFWGYGTRPGVTLSNTGTVSGQDVVLNTITSTNFSGTVTAPAGYTLGDRVVSFVCGTYGILIIADSNPPASSTSSPVSCVTPDITGGTLRMKCTATKAGKWVQGVKSGYAVNASGATLSLPDAPDYVLPVDAATGVTTSMDFSWTPLANAVFQVKFIGPAGQPTYEVVTPAATARIPNLASVGLGLPANVPYTWTITSVSPLTSVDAAASTTGFLLVVSPTVATETYTTFTGSNGGRTFTTAP